MDQDLRLDLELHVDDLHLDLKSEKTFQTVMAINGARITAWLMFVNA